MASFYSYKDKGQDVTLVDKQTNFWLTLYMALGLLIINLVRVLTIPSGKTLLTMLFLDKATNLVLLKRQKGHLEVMQL